MSRTIRHSRGRKMQVLTRPYVRRKRRVVAYKSKAEYAGRRRSFFRRQAPRGRHRGLLGFLGL